MRNLLRPPKRDHAYAPTPSTLSAGSFPARTSRSSGPAGLRALWCLLALFVFGLYSSYGQSPCPSGNCTSSDLTVTKVELVNAAGGAMPNICPPDGQPIQVKLKVTFDVTSQTRYGFLIVGDVYLNGVKADKVWACFGKEYGQGLQTEIVDKAFSWPCGSTIELRDVFTAWGNAAPATTICTYLDGATGAVTNCSAIDPKCKYYGSTTSFTVAAPLIADFTYSGTCPGNTLYKPLTFTSPATGAGATTGGNKPYQYSWQVTDVVSSAVVGTGTGASYTYTPASDHNLSVQLTVTDASTPTAAVAVATKTVTVETCCTPPTISGQPQDRSICAGGSASFRVAHSGGQPNPVVHWQVSSNGSTWTPLTNSAPYSNTTTTTLTITGATVAMNGYQYRAVLQSGVCAEVTSGAATLSVSPATVGGTVSPAQTVCINSAPATALSLSGQTGTVVRWQRSTDGFVANSTDITSTSPTLSGATIGALAQDTWFRAVVKSGVCDEAFSAMVKISVSPATVGGTVSGPQRICTGSQPVSNLSLSGQVGSVVKWQRSATAGFTSGVSDMAVTTTTLSASAIGVLTQDTWFRAVVKSGACAEGYSSVVKITVDPTSVGGSVSGAQTVCSGNQPASSLSLSGQVGSVVMWQRSTDNFNMNISNIAVGGTTLSPAQIGALTQDTWFRAVVKSGECVSVESGTVKITVQQPIGNNTIAAAQTICSATTPAALTGSTPSGGNGDYWYRWESGSNGSFTAIDGATGKDYAPGTLDNTTQFRRVVTAGNACASNTSAAITITISAESVVYPLEGSNYCATGPTKGTITLGGSYPGVSYQLTRAGDNSEVQAPKVGDGTMLTWTDVPDGQYYVKGTGIAPTYCTSQTAVAVVHEFDCSVFYTLTQGYYGSKNGKSCIGQTPVATIEYLLGNVELKVGTTKWLGVHPDHNGAVKLNSILPGGQTPNGLLSGTACYITSPDCLKNYLTKQGRLNNVLLAQTFTLSLNARWKEGELLLFPIRSGYLTTQKMTGCQDGAVVVDVCSDNTVSSIRMNDKVVSYLGEGATVKDLLKLANEALGGTVPAGVGDVPSYSDINEAVSAINESFDEGRRFLDYYAEKQSCEMLFPASVIVEPMYVTAPPVPAAREQATVAALSVRAYPNPFTDRVRFDVESPLSGRGSLELFNTLGQKVATVYQGMISAGRQSFEARLTGQPSASLVYVLRVGDKRVTGKLFRFAGH